MSLFINKYNPKKVNEVIGHDLELEKLANFVLNYKKQKKKAILIHGRSGIGKTCSAYALVNELNFEILDLNASEIRNKEIINYVVGNFMKQFSLFGKEKLIFIDELEGISGYQDYGGIQALQELIEISIIPIILATNDIGNEKFESIKKKCELLEFKNLDKDILVRHLENICKKEKISYKKNVLEKIAENCNGDLRASLIDLQLLINNKKELVDTDFIEKRLQDIDSRDIVAQLFKENDLVNSFRVLDNANINIYNGPGPVIFSDEDSILYWIEENLPRGVDNKDLAKAYNYLSKSDVFRGRIIRQQYWRFLVYQKLLIGGISTIKNKNIDFEHKKTRRSPKQNFLLWSLVSRRKTTIAEKFSKNLHTSKKDFIKNTLPYLKFIFKQNKHKDIAEEFKLEKEEIEYIKKQ